MRRVSREMKERVLEKLRKASSEDYVTEWSAEGKIGEQKKKSEMKKGKVSRGAGARFELLVRKDLEGQGWFVDKWSNNVDLDELKIVIAKRKFNPFSKVMTIGTGFPDFIAFQLVGEGKYSVVGFEVKMNGMLSKVEKEKCCFLLKQKVFNDIFIAKKGEKSKIKDFPCFQSKIVKRGSIEYVNFKERYEKFLDGWNAEFKSEKKNAFEEGDLSASE